MDEACYQSELGVPRVRSAVPHTKKVAVEEMPRDGMTALADKAPRGRGTPSHYRGLSETSPASSLDSQRRDLSRSRSSWMLHEDTRHGSTRTSAHCRVVRQAPFCSRGRTRAVLISFTVTHLPILDPPPCPTASPDLASVWILDSGFQR